MSVQKWVRQFSMWGLNGLFAVSLSHASTDVDITDLTDRGSISDTPHVVPNKKWLIEGGYQYQALKVDGPLSTFPQAQITRGVNFNTELFVILPSYYSLKKPPASGFDTLYLGSKHELIQGNDWLVSMQGIVALPGGSFDFGHHSVGGQLSAMATYSLNTKVSLAGMLGLATVSEPNLIGGGRFYSCNPSAVLVYTPIEKVNAFVEFFGNTKTDIFGGSIWAADCGLVYKVAENTALDFEFAQNLSHDRINYNHYLGGGVTALF